MIAYLSLCMPEIVIWIELLWLVKLKTSTTMKNTTNMKQEQWIQRRHYCWRWQCRRECVKRRRWWRQCLSKMRWRRWWQGDMFDYSDNCSHLSFIRDVFSCCFVDMWNMAFLLAEGAFLFVKLLFSLVEGAFSLVKLLFSLVEGAFSLVKKSYF